MLYIVLILLLAALGLVVTALVTASSLWAWISLGTSGLAGAVLIADLLRRRSKARTGAAERAEADTEAAGEADGTGDGKDTADSKDTADTEGTAGETAEPDKPEPARQTALLPSSGELRSVEGDPAEEETDAADLLVVSQLEVEVLVVDEYPRYHLAECAWLEDRDTIPIPVAEARDLGFTPCARCGPDAKLAAEHRPKRKSRAEG
ncbi:hypothetical protein [Qaidamihabitans albus]|uniref:hypothetical protein n=1 Tax=Qaidamihabitans albus TaxID=2795733 RepID=UPI0018F1F029|nr:hypothetical protein [Qaidamihabitans albus]